MSGPTRSPRSVLVVDPFSDERDMYAEFLRSRGYIVETCHDPIRAIEFAEKGLVSAVVSRVLQDGPIDGIELTRRLRAGHLTRDIPVVIITTRVEPHVRPAAMEAGCDAFLMLPCLPDELESELNRVCDERL